MLSRSSKKGTECWNSLEIVNITVIFECFVGRMLSSRNLRLCEARALSGFHRDKFRAIPKAKSVGIEPRTMHHRTSSELCCDVTSCETTWPLDLIIELAFLKISKTNSLFGWGSLPTIREVTRRLTDNLSAL